MKFSLQLVGSALMTAGLAATAQAAPVSHAIIDFEDLVIAQPTGVSTLASSSSAADVAVTNQYAQFGLQFSGPNLVTCSQVTGDPACTAPIQVTLPPHGGRNFLMNLANTTTGLYSGFSINILPGFSLSTLKLDLARNAEPFTIKFFDANGNLFSTPVNEQTQSDFRWTDGLDLGAVDAAVRRIDFGGDPRARFAIDYMSFDYTASSVNVPEPAMLSLVALALAGVGLSRRRRA